MCGFTKLLLCVVVPIALVLIFGGVVLCLPQTDAKFVRTDCLFLLTIVRTALIMEVLFLLYMLSVRNLNWTSKQWIYWFVMVVIVSVGFCMNLVNADRIEGICAQSELLPLHIAYWQSNFAPVYMLGVLVGLVAAVLEHNPIQTTTPLFNALVSQVDS